MENGKYIQSSELQKYIDWKNIMKMPRFSGGHDAQMQGLFKNAELIAHWNEGDYQGSVATCVKFIKGKFKGRYAIYTDFYGSCSGCDAWEDSSDEEVIFLCKNLANSAYIFKDLSEVVEYLSSISSESGWSAWNDIKNSLLAEINKTLKK